MRATERLARPSESPLAKVSCLSVLCFPEFNIHNALGHCLGAAWGECGLHGNRWWISEAVAGALD